MADGHKPSYTAPSARDAEDLLRKTVHLVDDPFVAISQSYKHKARETKLSPLFLEDDEER